MNDINEILPLIPAPDYRLFIVIIFIIILSLISFIIYKFFKKKKPIKKKIIYQKSNFIKDLDMLLIESKNTFDAKYWKKLSKIFKKFISENLDYKTHSLSLKEVLEKKHLSHLYEIFETFDKQFYYYEKKERSEFIKLINIIKNKIQ